VAIKRNRTLLIACLERLIKPNIALFHQWGVRYIAELCLNFPRLLNYNLEHVKEFLQRAELLGCLPLIDVQSSRLARPAEA
jgi:mTERF domain-containing protein, mitochondrial